MPPGATPPDFEKEKIERLRRAMYSRSLSRDIRPRERHNLHGNTSQVGEEWREEKGAELAGIQVAPRFIGLTRRILWAVLLASIAFFVVALGVFAYYFTLGGGSMPANPANIDITVTGPPSIAGGEPAELQISVTNRNRVTLEQANLVVRFPPGTRRASDYTTDLPVLHQPLGSIESGGRRQGVVPAVFSGSAGERVQVLVELEYRVAGSNSIYVASTEYPITFSSSPLSVSIIGNTQTVSGQPVQLTVEVTSNVAAPLRDVLLQIEYPFGFKFSEADPAPNSAGLWALGDFAPGQRKQIILEGVLSGEQDDTRVFRFIAGTRPEDASGGIQTRLADNSHTMRIAQPFLNLSVLVNNESRPAIVQPGDTVSVTVQYENNLASIISDGVIVARLSGLQLDGQTVQARDGFFRSADQSILWDKTTTGGRLESLNPGDRGVLTFTFIAPQSATLAGVVNPQLSVSVSAGGRRLSESGVPQNLQSTAQQTIRLATDLTMTAQALYYGSPLGSSGPMPPKAETETTYALLLTISNTTNRLENARVTARLPSYVRYIGLCSPATECDPSEGKLTFNALDSTFTWHMGDIDAGVGTGGVLPRQVAIAIGLTPSASQIGSQPVLVQDVTLTGTDSATGLVVIQTASPNVTTNLAQVGKTSEIEVGIDPGFSPANATVVR